MQNNYPESLIEAFSESQASIQKYVKSLGTFLEALDNKNSENRNISPKIIGISKKLLENLGDIQQFQVKKLQLFFPLHSMAFQHNINSPLMYQNWDYKNNVNAKNMIYFYKKYSYSPMPYIYIKNEDPFPPWKSNLIT